MRGGGHPINFIHGDPAHGPGGFAHIRCIDENDQAGFECAYFTGQVLRCYTGIEDKQMINTLSTLPLTQGTRHQGPGGIVAIQFVADADDRQARRSVRIGQVIS